MIKNKGPFTIASLVLVFAGLYLLWNDSRSGRKVARFKQAESHKAQLNDQSNNLKPKIKAESSFTDLTEKAVKKFNQKQPYYSPKEVPNIDYSGTNQDGELNYKSRFTN